MTNESAQAKLAKEESEKAKNYKCPHDVERVDHLISAAHLMRDYIAVNALAASIVRELRVINLKQEELDANDNEERAKKLAEAKAADEKMYAEQNEPKEANSTTPHVAPSVPRR